MVDSIAEPRTSRLGPGTISTGAAGERLARDRAVRHALGDG
jgi:hypothetical protein